MIRMLLKLFALIFLALLVAVGCQTVRHSGRQALPDQELAALRVATYNVHYIILSRETGAWSVGDWDRRKGPMDLAFKKVAADVIGFQEMESFAFRSTNNVNLTLDWLLENNPGYAAAAVGDPADFPSTQPILYRTARLEMLDQGWFFFSDTPDVIYSRTFNGSFPAFASWAQFRDRQSGAEFRVINIHTDFASRSNRIKTVELVTARIGPWIAADETVFLIGDLNARMMDRPVKMLEAAGLTFSPVRGATYHLNRGLNLFGAIDHIAYRGAVAPVGAPVVIREKFDGEWPTDHYPVVADFRLDP